MFIVGITLNGAVVCGFWCLLFCWGCWFSGFSVFCVFVMLFVSCVVFDCGWLVRLTVPWCLVVVRLVLLIA